MNIACNVLGTYQFFPVSLIPICIYDYESLWQETVNLRDLQVNELRKNIKHQETETLKAESKLKLSLEEM